MKPETLTIGRLAKAANVNIETIRHYQRKTLIDEPAKPSRGYRQYPLETVDRIRFIKRTQQLGFSLAEIQQLLLLGSKHCQNIQTLASEKRADIEHQIQGLLTIQEALNTLIGHCKNNDAKQQCTFFETLSERGFFDHADND